MDLRERGPSTMSRLMTLRCAALVVALTAAGCPSAPSGHDVVAADVSLRLASVDPAGAAGTDVEAALARGETVALVVWQTWCEPCAQEAPAIVAAQRQHGDAIRFIGVIPGKDEDVDPAEVAARRTAWGYTFPQARDRDLALCRGLDVDGTPTIVVLGPGRVVLYRGHRAPPDWTALRGRPLAAAPASTAPTGSACPGGVCPLPGSPAR